MSEHWALLEALLGGTAAMRKAKALMPRQPRESQEDYDYRLSTATLFPAFARTVGVMTGKPFSKQLTLNDNVPERIASLCADIDGEGRSLHVFAADLMADVIAFGFGGILVDYTKTDGGNKTQRDERESGARPHWLHVKHHQILGWRTEKKNGVNTLTQLRIIETVERDEGEFGSRVVRRVRVFTPGAWELHEEAGSGFALVDRGVMTIPVIPFVPVYGRRLGFMRGVSPLLDLAYQNVKHWQHQSDQDDSARFARKRLLVFVGVDKSDLATVTASSDSALALPAGDAKIVQGSAESVSVGRSELDALEAQMIQTGAELLTAKPGARTAFEAANDSEANKSDLQNIVESLEDSLDQALQRTADWYGLPDGGSVTLFKDFAAGGLSDASAQLLLAMQQGGVISTDTLIREQQRRGILSPDIDPAHEREVVAAEGPPLGAMNDANGQ